MSRGTPKGSEDHCDRRQKEVNLPMAVHYEQLQNNILRTDKTNKAKHLKHKQDVKTAAVISDTHWVQKCATRYENNLIYDC